MGKIRKLIAAIIMIATLGGATMFGACTTDEGDSTVTDEPIGLEIGFSASGAPRPADSCAIRSEKRIFDIDNVELTFYFGRSLPTDDYDVEKAREKSSIPEFDVYFADENYEPLYMIRHSDENFVSEEYRVKYDIGEGGFKGLIFNHSEKVIIPKELFADRYGEICFCVAGIDVMRAEYEYKPIVIQRLFYEVKNDKVVLSVWNTMPT